MTIKKKGRASYPALPARLQETGLVKSRCIVSGLEKKTIWSGWCLSRVGWVRSCFSACGVRNEAKRFEAKSSDWSGLIFFISQNSLFRYLTGTKAPQVTCKVGV